MKQEIIETIHLIADDGKVFRRIESGEIMGRDIYLGYSHYIGDKLLEEPHKDVPEDFEEIDEIEKDVVDEIDSEPIEESVQELIPESVEENSEESTLEERIEEISI
jgi:hypothetical protein